MRNVLFLCSANSARSFLAKAVLDLDEDALGQTAWRSALIAIGRTVEGVTGEGITGEGITANA